MENASHNCESHYQVALERRAAGLSVQDVQDLEAHLASCPACCDYAQTIERMAVMIQASNAAVEGNGSWRRASAYIERKERERTISLKRQVPFGIGAGALVVAGGLWTENYSVLLFGIGWMLQSVFIIGYQRYRARKLAALASSSDDILLVAKRELGRRYFVAVSGMIGAVLFALIYFGYAFELVPEWFAKFLIGGNFVLRLVLGGCFLVLVWSIWSQALPRLRRERKRLE